MFCRSTGRGTGCGGWGWASFLFVVLLGQLVLQLPSTLAHGRYKPRHPEQHTKTVEKHPDATVPPPSSVTDDGPKAVEDSGLEEMEAIESWVLEKMLHELGNLRQIEIEEEGMSEFEKRSSLSRIPARGFRTLAPSKRAGCSDCKYCKFCKYCAQCPCAKDDKNKNCKYCKECDNCKYCKTLCCFPCFRTSQC